jgi:hypothetical protein
MALRSLPVTNFAFLQEHDVQLLRLGLLAERYFPDDPNTCLLKLRQLAELLAQLTASNVGLYLSPEETQFDLLRRLGDQGFLPGEVSQLFGEIRRAGNTASHTLTVAEGLLIGEGVSRFSHEPAKRYRAVGVYDNVVLPSPTT